MVLEISKQHFTGFSQNLMVASVRFVQFGYALGVGQLQRFWFRFGRLLWAKGFSLCFQYNRPIQSEPIQKRAQVEFLQFVLPSPHEATVWPSASVAKNMCFSI